jgi:hypothetical protein
LVFLLNGLFSGGSLPQLMDYFKHLIYISIEAPGSINGNRAHSAQFMGMKIFKNGPYVSDLRHHDTANISALLG